MFGEIFRGWPQRPLHLLHMQLHFFKRNASLSGENKYRNVPEMLAWTVGYLSTQYGFTLLLPRTSSIQGDLRLLFVIRFKSRPML
jgi:hypothetical protein